MSILSRALKRYYKGLTLFGGIRMAEHDGKQAADVTRPTLTFGTANPPTHSEVDGSYYLCIAASAATEDRIWICSSSTWTRYSARVRVDSDPGDGNAIPVDDSMAISLSIGAGAETNTLAIPNWAGQRLSLICSAVGGGHRAVTVASDLNVGGDDTMTFNAVDDLIILEAVDRGGTLCWREIANENVALS